MGQQTEIKIDATITTPGPGQTAWGVAGVPYEYFGGPYDGAVLMCTTTFMHVDISIGPRWVGTYYPSNAGSVRPRLVWWRSPQPGKD